MRTIIILLLVCSPVFGALENLLPEGIDSYVLAEKGTGILIGQIENARSGKWNYDDPLWSASNTVLSWFSVNWNFDGLALAIV